ncbi:MAG: HIT family protein [Bryobacteraceae bacterium]
MADEGCIFCKIVAGTIPANMVYRDKDVIAFLDIDPLFPGHVLLSPREHYATLTELPVSLAGPMMEKTQILAAAVDAALDAEGTFIAINNRVSQLVPHLHIHVVPRRRKDGLRGFFWPRHQYKDEAAREAVRDAIEREIKKLIKD